ncbi:hypothetical protein RRG08_024485 [Elysia crispata]|uniref:Uncharacterized protein n=1 Tax=Elysia crispata TaxID=231223 RepID=A0AAE1D2U0_9GAST|nr:hypothetical protein RRG08_024485 [Elysia crispata]
MANWPILTPRARWSSSSSRCEVLEPTSGWLDLGCVNISRHQRFKQVLASHSMALRSFRALELDLATRLAAGGASVMKPH